MDIYTDASFSYSTQRAGLGVFAKDEGIECTYNVKAYSIASAEISAIVRGCVLARRGDTIFNDNLTIVKALNSRREIKNNTYWSGCILRILKAKRLTLAWICREDENQRVADKLAKLSLRREGNL